MIVTQMFGSKDRGQSPKKRSFRELNLLKKVPNGDPTFDEGLLHSSHGIAQACDASALRPLSLAKEQCGSDRLHTPIGHGRDAIALVSRQSQSWQLTIRLNQRPCCQALTTRKPVLIEGYSKAYQNEENNDRKRGN